MTTYSYTLEIDDSDFIMLENLLNERIKYLRETKEIFKKLSDECHLGCEESVLKKLKKSYKTAVMTSTSSFCSAGKVKLWSPKK
jgi:hypothetical protein